MRTRTAMVLLPRLVPAASLPQCKRNSVVSYARRRMRALANKGSPRLREKPEAITSTGRFGRRAIITSVRPYDQRVAQQLDIPISNTPFRQRCSMVPLVP